MFKSRLFRILVCVVLICCIIFNCSPINIHAASIVAPAAPVVAAVPGLNVVAAVLIGLGVLVGIAVTDWDTVLNNCAEWLEEQGIIDENGNCKIIKFLDQNGGLPKWFADVALIEMIHQWLYDEQVVTETVGQEGYAYYNGVFLPDVDPFWVDYNVSYPYCVIYFNDTQDSYHFLLLNKIVSYRSDSSLGGNIGAYSGMLWRNHVLNNGSWIMTYAPTSHSGIWFCDISGGAHSLVWSNFDIVDENGELFFSSSDPVPAGSSIYSSFDVSLGEVASSDTAIADGYTTWAENATTVTGSTIGGSDDEEIAVFPLGLGQTWEDTRELTQEDVWAGTSTYEDTSTGSGTGSNTGTSTDTWTPPENPAQFALDLSNYFPFCIPFDLYDFFSCLNADPVAPVIQWELPLPGGSTYPIELDLSPFDSVAQLLRRLELLLFIVGLAIKTRDLIKG